MAEQKPPMIFFREESVPHDQRVQENVSIFDLLDKSLVAVREKENESRYRDRQKSLGAGRVGHPLSAVPYNRGCERAIWYEYKQYTSERPFPANLYRIFAMGHAAEETIVENLRAAGFTVVTHKTLEDGTEVQHGFAMAWDPETKQPRYKGYCDGIITAGPAELDGVKLRYPMLWENKALNDKNFDKVLVEGVEKAKPEYYAQAQQYMNFLGLYENPCMMTFLNRDTGDLRCELVRYNKKHCQAIIERAARVIEAKAALSLERAAKEYTQIPCKFCSYRGQCEKDEQSRFSGNVIRSPEEAPSWLAKKS